MKRFIHGFLLVAFLAIWLSPTLCADDVPLAHGALGLDNGCFVESVLLADAFSETYGSEAWVRVLRWGAEKDEEAVMGHAVAVCEAKGSLWCWDINFGWKKVQAPISDKEDAQKIAPEITARYPDMAAVYPNYFDASGQEADPTPPPDSVSSTVAEVQQVATCAAALAKHRPTYAVTFNHGPDDALVPGAAVFFPCGGRICVYSPSRGTFPIMARGSLRNARFVSEVLHRIFPGTRDIQPLVP